MVKGSPASRVRLWVSLALIMLARPFGGLSATTYMARKAAMERAKAQLMLRVCSKCSTRRRPNPRQRMTAAPANKNSNAITSDQSPPRHQVIGPKTGNTALEAANGKSRIKANFGSHSGVYACCRRDGYWQVEADAHS